MSNNIKINVLSNGIKVVYEPLTLNKVVSIGVFIKGGSNYENNQEAGISHFIEHMLFKGTNSKSAKDIAIISDKLGGRMNAYTSKDLTCFYIKTISEHVEQGIELLSDLINNSLLDSYMIESEKHVVLEEIAMYEDVPEDFVHEKLQEGIWKGSALALPILGYKKTVEDITREKIVEYMNKHYTTADTVISVCGSFEQDKMTELLEKYFSTYTKKENEFEENNDIVEFNKVKLTHFKKVEQAYLSIAFSGTTLDSKERFALSILSSALGQSMSSRLFQIVREERSLVYNIGSSNESYRQAGILNIYAGCSPDKFGRVMDSIQEIILDIYTNGLQDLEIENAREQIRCSLLLSLESTDSKMMANGRNLLLRKRIIEREETLQAIANVTAENVADVIKDKLNWDNKALSILYPGNSKKTKIPYPL